MQQTFGRYQLLAPLGQGGMAELFRARLLTPAGGEKFLVIKRILPAFSSDPELLRLFVNEAKIAMALTHGNIVSVFEFGEVDGQYFIAMEYIRGQNLERALKGGRLPPAASFYVAAEIAKALAYAHDFTDPKGNRIAVVHQDVSPENVLLSYDGAVKLADFGIARVLASRESNPEVLRGKAAYLAPEQLQGHAASPKSDVFSLGAVLYEMLAGRPPFQAGTDEEILDKLRRGVAEPPSAIDPALAPFDEVVMRALALDPAQRYANAHEMSVALTSAMFKLAPDFGAGRLAEWMKEQFAFEVYEDELERSGKDGLRDRLIFQMAKADIEVGARDVDIKELLSMKTVVIPPSPAEPTDEAPSVRWVQVGLGVVLALGVATAGIFAARPDRVEGVDAGAVPAGVAFLSLNSWPSATVYLDDQLLPGRTPIIRHEVTPGRHKLRFVKPEFGLQKEIEVELAAGGERTLSVKLER